MLGTIPQLKPEWTVKPIPVGTWTLEDINRANVEFWRQQTVRDKRHMEDRKVLGTALAMLVSECQRGVPIRNQLTLSVALETVERSRKQWSNNDLARMGGLASKTDVLSAIILEKVAKRPNISEVELIQALCQDKGMGVIHDIDENEIVFTAKNGKLKSVKRSGLKDRLFRARKKVRSR